MLLGPPTGTETAPWGSWRCDTSLFRRGSTVLAGPCTQQLPVRDVINAQFCRQPGTWLYQSAPEVDTGSLVETKPITVDLRRHYGSDPRGPQNPPSGRVGETCLQPGWAGLCMPLSLDSGWRSKRGKVFLASQEVCLRHHILGVLPRHLFSSAQSFQT